MAAATRYLKISEAKTPFATTSSLQGMHEMLGPCAQAVGGIIFAGMRSGCRHCLGAAVVQRSNVQFHCVSFVLQCVQALLDDAPLGFAVAGGWIPSASWMRDIHSALADHRSLFLIDLFQKCVKLSSVNRFDL